MGAVTLASLCLAIIWTGSNERVFIYYERCSHEETQIKDGREPARSSYRDPWRRTAAGRSGDSFIWRPISVGWRPTRFDPDDNSSGGGPDVGDFDSTVC